MANKSKMAFGSRANLDAAIQSGKVDNFDILLLSGENEKPAMGWVDNKTGKPIIIEQTDLSGVEAELATKANAEEVDTKIVEAKVDTLTIANAYTDNKLEAAMSEHLAKKYEITDIPSGALVNYRDGEIRIMCPVDTVFTKQAVGEGGDVNSHYCTFKTYVPNDSVVGYIEHLGENVDNEVLTKFSIDEYGRRYQTTWLALAKYDETTNSWSYHGANSTIDKFIGWNYQIDWYDIDGVIIASDSVRINLSNEQCHFSIKPYYGVSTTEEIEEKVEEKVEEVVVTKVEEAVATSNAYTDAQIEAKMAEIGKVEIVEF